MAIKSMARILNVFYYIILVAESKEGEFEKCMKKMKT